MTMTRAEKPKVFHRDFLGAHRYTTGGGTARPAGGVLPSYKTKQTDEAGNAIYKDICNPITKDFRERLNAALMESYERGGEVIIETDSQETVKSENFVEANDEIPFPEGLQDPIETKPEKAESKIPGDRKPDKAFSKAKTEEKPKSIKDRLKEGELKKVQQLKPNKDKQSPEPAFA